MTSKLRTFISILLVSGFLHSGCTKTNHTTESIDIRKVALKEWSAMKFGMFIHWGVYSIPAGVWKGQQIEKLGEQIQRHAYIPHDEYIEIAKEFNPVNFDAEGIVKLAKNTGMKYIVFTAKHHDGFCMFDSKHTNFDIMETATYKKDILKMLAKACKKHGIKLGLYYSTPDWHFNGPNPEINPSDGKISVFSKVSKANEDYQVAQLEELLTNYGDIVELFFDMGEPTYEQSKRFADVIHRLQPKCVINGRIMNNQGDFITMPDNHVPDMPVEGLAWETPGTFYHTWGYKSWVKGAPVKEQVKAQIHKLITITARGGNFLLNIGPRSDGSVVPYEVEVLSKMGLWVQQNSEAIFETGTTPFQGLDWGECTTKPGKLYLHIMKWPEDGKLTIPGLSNTIENAYLLNEKNKKIYTKRTAKGQELDLIQCAQDPNLTVLVVEYNGELDIKPPHVNTKNNIVSITDKDMIRHGKYGRLSYRSILKDYSRSCYIEIKEAGNYTVELNYKLRYPSKDFIIEVANNKLLFNLTGKGNTPEKVIAIDGNESPINKKQQINKDGFRNTTIGTLSFDKPGIYELKFKQGKEYNFTSTLEEFQAQDMTYRTMNITVNNILIKKK